MKVLPNILLTLAATSAATASEAPNEHRTSATDHLRTSLTNLHTYLTTAQHEVAAMRWTELPADLCAQLSAVKLGKLSWQTLQLAWQNPKTTIYITTAGIFLAPPPLVALPVLVMGNLVGFKPTGPCAGSMAARIQPWVAPVAGRHGFATLQSAGMGGYGVAKVAAVVRRSAVVVAGATGAWSYLNGGKSDDGGGDCEGTEGVKDVEDIEDVEDVEDVDGGEMEVKSEL